MARYWKLRLARIEYRIALFLYDKIATMGERLIGASGRFEARTAHLEKRYGGGLFEDIIDARFSRRPAASDAGKRSEGTC